MVDSCSYADYGSQWVKGSIGGGNGAIPSSTTGLKFLLVQMLASKKWAPITHGHWLPQALVPQVTVAVKLVVGSFTEPKRKPIVLLLYTVVVTSDAVWKVEEALPRDRDYILSSADQAEVVLQ